MSSETDSCIQANYGVLMLKRSSKSSFFPNALVFPGGGYDAVSGLIYAKFISNKISYLHKKLN